MSNVTILSTELEGSLGDEVMNEECLEIWPNLGLGYRTTLHRHVCNAAETKGQLGPLTSANGAGFCYDGGKWKP